jgi:hypothetical protein
MPRQPLNYNPTAELTQVIASPNIQGERAGHDPRASSAFRLAEALGIAMPVLEKFGQDYERKKLEEQTAQLEHFKEVFAQDREGGAVSQAQVKERFPETVPVIAARIAEGMGKRDADQKTSALIAEINTNDELRLDPTKRTSFIQQKRAEMFGQIPKGHEFYSSGFAAGMDAQLQQWDNSWKREDAAFHEKVQAEGLSKEVVTAINSGQSLEPIDKKWAASSSLNHLERNKIVIDTVVDTALVNDQPELLKKVPARFLNAAAKEALRVAEVRITENRFATMRQAELLKDRAKSEELVKLKTEMLDGMAAGKPVDPLKYHKNHDAFEFAVRMKDLSLVDEVVSASHVVEVEQEVLNGATVGTSADLESLADRIRLSPRLTVQHKKGILEKLPKLMEGRTLMEDPTVRQPINDRLGPRLQALESSTNGALMSLLKGRNLRSEVMKQYTNDVRRLFRAEFEDTGRWPKGHRKEELIDKAVDRAESTLEKWTKIGGASAKQSQAAPAVAPAAGPKPIRRSVKDMPGVYRIE